MTYSDNLKMELKYLSLEYSIKNNFIPVKPIPKSAFIFKNISDNFFGLSFDNTKKNENWGKRLHKIHTDKRIDFEMQSSNSSDTLLMNIFSHPNIKNWKGVAKLFDIEEVEKIDSIKYGINPEIMKNGAPEQRARKTEIDLLINGEIICEAKLTEKDFTDHSIDDVELYDKFVAIFKREYLDQTEVKYKNYQLIRNIIALDHKKYKRFYLICDLRRPDLIKAFLRTILCIKDISLRSKCGIIFWQDLANSVEKDLQNFLHEKYRLLL
jgi:hypothetical protein